MEAVDSFETSLSLYQKTKTCVPEGRILRDESFEADSKFILRITTTNNK